MKVTNNDIGEEFLLANGAIGTLRAINYDSIEVFVKGKLERYFPDYKQDYSVLSSRMPKVTITKLYSFKNKILGIHGNNIYEYVPTSEQWSALTIAQPFRQIDDLLDLNGKLIVLSLNKLFEFDEETCSFKKYKDFTFQ